MTEEKRTQFAMAAVDFAGLFNTFFEPVSLAGQRVRLTAPEGQSTGGGVQALQHITLVDEAGGRTVVIGHCHTADKSAELRLFDHVAERFGQRYEGQPFPVPRAEYDDLRHKLEQFITGQGYRVSVARPKAPAAQPAPARSGGSAGWIIALALLLAAIGGGLAWYFLVHQG